MSTSSYFPFSAYQTRRVEESEPKANIRQHENKGEPSSDDKITYTLKNHLVLQRKQARLE